MEPKKDRFWKLLEPEYVRANMFCRRLAGDATQGDDVFEDALIIAYRKFHQLRDEMAFRSWLYRVMANTYTSSVRSSWFRRRVDLTPEIEQTLVGDDPLGRHTAGRWLKRAMAVLSPQQRVLITLHELEGWTLTELSELTGKPESALKSRLFRARNRMRKAIEKYSVCATENRPLSDKTDEETECSAARLEPE
ncbi:MAG TPA: RNA polymerase sigma factor [candidate division Zixibacteria bacterium]|nr:RNA polymerase sigma factor [candidate division Zixibacteria bacterium]